MLIELIASCMLVCLCDVMHFDRCALHMLLLGHAPAAVCYISCVCLSVCVGKPVHAMQISPLGYAFGRPKISSTVSRMHGGGRTNHQLKSYSCACLSVCLCSNACSCIAGVLSGLCFWRRCRASAQFPAEIPRQGFSLHALTHGGERAHYGPF